MKTLDPSLGYNINRLPVTNRKTNFPHWLLALFSFAWFLLRVGVTPVDAVESVSLPCSFRASHHSSMHRDWFPSFKHNARSTQGWWRRLISVSTKHCMLLCYRSNTAKGLTEVWGSVCPRLLWLKSFLCCHPVCCDFSLLSLGLLIEQSALSLSHPLTPLFCELGSRLTRLASLELCINQSWYLSRAFRLPRMKTAWALVHLFRFFQRCWSFTES